MFLELLFYGMVDWLVRLCFSGGKLRVLGLLIAMMDWCFGCIVVVCLFCCGWRFTPLDLVGLVVYFGLVWLMVC